jgi:hypothetical protein
MSQDAVYQAPSVEQLKEIFGEQLKEISITEQRSDVDDFVVSLERRWQKRRNTPSSSDRPILCAM